MSTTTPAKATEKEVDKAAREYDEAYAAFEARMKDRKGEKCKPWNEWEPLEQKELHNYLSELY